MFRRFFGLDKKKDPPSEKKSVGGGGTIQTLEQIESAYELLEKRENVLEKKVEAELARAKEYHAKKNTPAALQCMKRKKAYEDQLQNIFAQKQNLETLKFTLQNQNINNELLEVQQRVKDELKTRNERMNADRVEEDMEALQDEMEKANAVAEALRQPLDMQVVDEDELMEELMGELQNVSATTTETPLPALPSVPTSVLPQHKKKTDEDEEEALRALEAELQS